MIVGGMPIFSMCSSSFSLQTVLHALLKSRSVNTEPFIRRCWKPSSAAWTIEVKPAPSFTKTGLESTEHVVGFGNVVETISKNTIEMFDNT